MVFYLRPDSQENDDMTANIEGSGGKLVGNPSKDKPEEG